MKTSAASLDVKPVSPSAQVATIAKGSDESIPYALRNFDALPDAAYVRLPVVCGLFACSAPTVWRKVKQGSMPAPRKLSESVTAWNVGLLRKALCGESWK